MNKEIKLLFVCMGNICRSPTAEGVFTDLVRKHELSDVIIIDSAGTHAYHVSEPPDNRAQIAARKRNIDLSTLRARKAHEKDFHHFDYLLAMDRSNYEDLLSICPEGMESKLHLFLNFASELDEKDVPDPYYGGPSGFERVLDMIEEASQGLLEHLVEKHRLK
jgi:protein-tyrosine phosphatase